MPRKHRRTSRQAARSSAGSSTWTPARADGIGLQSSLGRVEHRLEERPRVGDEADLGREVQPDDLGVDAHVDEPRAGLMS